MKKRYQITLEDEAAEILDKQENKSQFLSDLILHPTTPSQGTPPWFDIMKGIDTINTKLENLKSVPQGDRDILAEIKQREAQRDEELKYCQDTEEVARIGLDAQNDINTLWKEYHENK